MARHIPVQPDTVFDLASLSKQFTGAAIMILAQRGQLSLDDNVKQYLPEIPDDVPPVKLRHLSQHTSGLPEFPAGATLQTESARSTWLSHLRGLEFPPGGGWAYRNSNYYLLARIVERVSGTHLRAFLQKEIFDPAGMKNAQVLDSPDGVIRNRATGYCFGNPCRQDDGFTGAGGVFASLDDMLAWDAALRNESIVKTRDLTAAAQPVRYGLGWRFVSSGHSAMEHDGDAIGARTLFVRYLEAPLTIIILSNQTRLDVEALRTKLADAFW